MSRLAYFIERWVYMTERRAAATGYTNHASYYGVPLYVVEHGDELKVAAKVGLLDLLLPVISVIEQLVAPNALGFMFCIGPPLEPAPVGADDAG